MKSPFRSLTFRSTLTALSFLALAATARDARAYNLVTNGDFADNPGPGQLTVGGYNLPGWTGLGKEGNFGSQTTPPVFVFNLGTADQLATTGVNGDAFMGNVRFYNAVAAPGDGVVLAAAGETDWDGGIRQTISGLTIGDTYTLTFNWAAAQMRGFIGATTGKWQVTFGSSTLSTAIANTPSQSFGGWQTAELEFVATAQSQLLTFQAVGTPAGLQPWLLLNDVSLVPEPTSLSLLALAAVGALTRRRCR